MCPFFLTKERKESMIGITSITFHTFGGNNEESTR